MEDQSIIRLLEDFGITNKTHTIVIWPYERIVADRTSASWGGPVKVEDGFLHCMRPTPENTARSRKKKLIFVGFQPMTESA